MAELVTDARRDAALFARTVLAVPSSVVDAYIEFRTPLNSGVALTEHGLADLHQYRQFVAEPAGAAWMDNTTLVTAATLMSDKGLWYMTPLTVWDLATFARAVTSYRFIYHHEHPDVDTAAINARLGDEVLVDVPLPYAEVPVGAQLPAPWEGAHRLLCDAWFAADSWVKRLAGCVGADTLDGRLLEAVRSGWQAVLGRPLRTQEFLDASNVSQRWTSPCNRLLSEIADATGAQESAMYVDLSPSFRDLDRERRELGIADHRRQSEMLTDLNLRAYVNQHLASFFQLPYACASSRMPFRAHLYNRAVGVSQQLATLDLLDHRYREIAGSVTLRLPVLLAIALRGAKEPGGLWDTLADMRAQSSRFRERRAEFDDALAHRDLTEVAAAAKALNTDADNVLKVLGEATIAAGLAVVPALATGDVTGIALGVAGAEAASKKLLPSSLAKRLVWSLGRPELLWLNETVNQAKHLTEAWPDFSRVWKIPDRERDDFAARLGTAASLVQW